MSVCVPWEMSSRISFVGTLVSAIFVHTSDFLDDSLSSDTNHRDVQNVSNNYSIHVISLQLRPWNKIQSRPCLRLKQDRVKMWDNTFSCIFKKKRPWETKRLIWSTTTLVKLLLFLQFYVLLTTEATKEEDRHVWPVFSINLIRRIFTSLCFVGLWTALQKNYWTYFHETGMKDESRPRIDPFKFWWGSGKRDGSRNLFLSLLKLWISSDIFGHFSEENESWCCISVAVIYVWGCHFSASMR